ncbi:MAG: universal stress protein [Verrucomicrobiota bacterium]
MVGPPSDELTCIACNEASDMVAMYENTGIELIDREPWLDLRLQNILVPLDFSTASLKTLRYASSLAGQFGSSLSLIHVVERGSFLEDLLGVRLSHSDDEAVRAATRLLIQHLRQVLPPASKGGTLLRVGKPACEIAKAARELGCDLIVMSTHGYTKPKHLLVSNIAERVIRHPTCPALILREELLPQEEREPVKRSSIAWKNILVPIDLQECSLRALECAARLAGLMNAKLTLFYVPGVTSRKSRRAIWSNPFQTQVPRIVQSQISACVQQKVSASLAVEIWPEIGAPTPEGIVQVAKHLGTDLIVIGTQASCWWRHLIDGHFVEGLLRMGRTAVLSVPGRTFDEAADADITQASQPKQTK